VGPPLPTAGDRQGLAVLEDADLAEAGADVEKTA
jgi:hypothetical protein